MKFVKPDKCLSGETLQDTDIRLSSFQVMGIMPLTEGGLFDAGYRSMAVMTTQALFVFKCSVDELVTRIEE